MAMLGDVQAIAAMLKMEPTASSLHYLHISHGQSSLPMLQYCRYELMRADSANQKQLDSLLLVTPLCLHHHWATPFCSLSYIDKTD